MAELGVVRWFNDNKGYGFIVRDLGTELFVHYADIVREGRKTLSEGDRVQFDVVEFPKPRATNVVKID